MWGGPCTSSVRTVACPVTSDPSLRRAQMSPALTSYDEIPYESHPYPQSHPERLATVATLFGMTPPPIEACRVLELGCAAGGNLIPMAQTLPGSTFLGIELSARQADEGRATIEALK